MTRLDVLTAESINRAHIMFMNGTLIMLSWPVCLNFFHW